MKVTVDLSENELREITEITGISRKGPAIRKLLTNALQLQRRAAISAKFLSGEWSAGLEGFDAAKAAERAETLTLSESWRD